MSAAATAVAQEQNVAERTETVKAGDSRGNIAPPGEEKSAEASASSEEQETTAMPATRSKGTYWLFQPIYTKVRWVVPLRFQGCFIGHVAVQTPPQLHCSNQAHGL